MGAIFYDGFTLVISYRPGSGNVTPDLMPCLGISHQRALKSDTDLILPSGFCVASITWEIKSVVKRVQEEQVGSPGIVYVCLTGERRGEEGPFSVGPNIFGDPHPPPPVNTVLSINWLSIALTLLTKVAGLTF